jgi:acetyl esterase/lipase
MDSLAKREIFFPQWVLFRFYCGMQLMIFRLIFFSICASALLQAQAGPTNMIHLWPKGAPGEKGDIGAEYDTTTEKSDLIAGQRLIRLGNVSDPTITVYPADPRNNTGAAVLVCPGGGYHILAMDLEGSEVCEWLNSIGVTGVLLKYRVPARKDQEKHIAPLQDAQRAMGIIRQHATEWRIDPKRIGALGFSAGGHLAAVLSGNNEKRIYDKVDSADDVACRPDFTVLIYPGYLTIKEQDDKVNPDTMISSNTPPTFLTMTEDDPVRVEGALYYYAALKKANVPAELHIYPTGGHGYGLRKVGKAVSTWPKRAEEWMRESGFLGK